MSSHKGCLHLLSRWKHLEDECVRRLLSFWLILDLYPPTKARIVEHLEFYLQSHILHNSRPLLCLPALRVCNLWCWPTLGLQQLCLQVTRHVQIDHRWLPDPAYLKVRASAQLSSLERSSRSCLFFTLIFHMGNLMNRAFWWDRHRVVSCWIDIFHLNWRTQLYETQ